MHLDPDMTLEEIMRAWPPAISVILRHHMLCVGCPITAFHTVNDACREHMIDEGAFLEELRAAIAAVEGAIIASRGFPPSASGGASRKRSRACGRS
uniref:DUF1858 domain-containing protein n=1 Tax=Chelativorans sp. (strain BNC1) TaxID=266779 RepID=Q11G38_CHESB